GDAGRTWPGVQQVERKSTAPFAGMARLGRVVLPLLRTSGQSGLPKTVSVSMGAVTGWRCALSMMAVVMGCQSGGNPPSPGPPRAAAEGAGTHTPRKAPRPTRLAAPSAAGR